MLKKTMGVNLNVLITIEQVTDTHYDITIGNVPVASIEYDPATELFFSRLINIPETVSFSKAKLSFCSESRTLESASGQIVEKLANILLNRYIKSPKIKPNKIK